VHQSIWAQQEHLAVAAQPEPPRTSALPTVPVAEIPSEKPLPAGDPDIPWWLSDVPGQCAEQPIPLLWQGEKAGKSRKEGTPLGPDPVGFPRLSDPSWIKRGGSPPPQPVSERSGGAHGYCGPEPAQSPAHLAEQEEAPERLTSRLSGLRNLLTGLGLKEVNSSANDLENAHRTPLDRGNSTAAAPTQSSLSNAPSAASTATAVALVSSEVSAQPEFLKPASNVAEFRQEESKAKEKSSQRTSQPATEFEEATLPSRRGQYRNL
jgi:hypothetical protein